MRKEFGLSAREVFTEIPEWELNVLLAERQGELDDDDRDRQIEEARRIKRARGV